MKKFHQEITVFLALFSGCSALAAFAALANDDLSQVSTLMNQATGASAVSVDTGSAVAADPYSSTPACRRVIAYGTLLRDQQLLAYGTHSSGQELQNAQSATQQAATAYNQLKANSPGSCASSSLSYLSCLEASGGSTSSCGEAAYTSCMTPATSSAYSAQRVNRQACSDYSLQVQTAASPYVDPSAPGLTYTAGSSSAPGQDTSTGASGTLQ